MRLAVPDLVSNSYFPCAAAAALGAYEACGLHINVVHISPVEACAAALRDGDVDFIGASAHAPLTAFPDWRGARLLCAQSQRLYWFLVMRSDLGIARGDLSALAGRTIAAVPFVAVALDRILAAAGIDRRAAGIEIVSPPHTPGRAVNFGVAAAEALARRDIDGFFANGMGAEIAVTRGVGSIVLDVRRGDGPPECFDYTMPAVATTDALIARDPDAAAAVVRAVVRTQKALAADPALAATAGRTLFPAAEAELIAGIVARDIPYYSPVISERFVSCMSRYAHAVGLLSVEEVPYETVVATQFSSLWA
ncbi:ABC transporter substrate-binding protein [Rhodoplanes roseus]|uniref:SsuA/THI5-like domain-containing protein n=1 Tax=Rhodoplanes roseus TaxID=29409 RepID=A0A327KXW9_9BRAD|nr:ABC transporter substrate-binding protein [Rhodoplanes roseus]RAI43121.1 hypothetical protein CH341_15960 [Rhodoplanes roseus]